MTVYSRICVYECVHRALWVHYSIIHMNACIIHHRCSLHRKCYHCAATGPTVADNVFLSYVVLKTYSLTSPRWSFWMPVRSLVCAPDRVSPVSRARLLRCFGWVQQPRWLPEHLLVSSESKLSFNIFLKITHADFSTRNTALRAHKRLKNESPTSAFYWGIVSNSTFRAIY